MELNELKNESKLKIIDYFHGHKTSKNGLVYNAKRVKVECPECLNQYWRNYFNLGKTERCRPCETKRKNKDKIMNGHRSFKNLSSTLVGSFKQKAKARNIEWDLTIEQLNEILELQGNKCALTGLPIVLNAPTIFTSTGKSRHIDSSKITGSLDRIDSSKDYTIDNVQWVHKIINIMKNTLNNNDFIWFCKEVANNFKEKDNSEPSFINGNCGNAIMKKVQRLTLEDNHSNKRDTRIPHPNKDDDIV